MDTEWVLLCDMEVYLTDSDCSTVLSEEAKAEQQNKKKPKKSLHCSAYNMFFKELIQNKPKTKDCFAEIARSASEQWSTMSPTRKNEYAIQAQEHRIRLQNKVTSGQLYQCKNCGKTANHHKDLIGHEKECGQVFPCDICGMKFKESRNLKTHVKCVHNKIKSFNCLICEQKFAFKKDLARHQVVHNGQKPFTCSTCNKTFSWQSNMKRHKKISGHA
uniref:Protein krueppel n=1 Tax=Strigamia maritima TaxID=126957 RepID=T1JHW1_STRMM